jgi:hypothetical protein
MSPAVLIPVAAVSGGPREVDGRDEEGIMMEWRDQVAVVTGGARGFGRATAWILANGSTHTFDSFECAIHAALLTKPCSTLAAST